MSGVVLAGTWPAQKRSTRDSANNPAASSTGSGAADADEGLDPGDAEASPAVRHLHAGMLLNYRFLVYNPHLDKATNKAILTTQVKVFRDRQAIFTGKENPFDSTGAIDPKRLIGGGTIQLGSQMAPGDYVLQIIVVDTLADQKYRVATQWIDFTIVK